MLRSYLVLRPIPNASTVQRSTNGRRSRCCSKVSLARSTAIWALSGKQTVTGCSGASVLRHANGARRPCTVWRRPSNSDRVLVDAKT